MQTPAVPRKKIGRPSKGDRVGTFVNLPVELRRAAEEIAREDDLPLGAIITRLVASALGRPAPAYCFPIKSDQQELPLNRAS